MPWAQRKTVEIMAYKRQIKKFQTIRLFVTIGKRLLDHFPAPIVALRPILRAAQRPHLGVTQRARPQRPRAAFALLTRQRLHKRLVLRLPPQSRQVRERGERPTPPPPAQSPGMVLIAGRWRVRDHVLLGGDVNARHFARDLRAARIAFDS